MTASNSGIWKLGDGAGGAVRTAHGIVEIGNNVGFINCTGGSGGGLYSESFTTIGDNVVFEGNKGRRGGALNVVDDYEDYLTDPDYASGARRVSMYTSEERPFQEQQR